MLNYREYPIILDTQVLQIEWAVCLSLSLSRRIPCHRCLTVMVRAPLVFARGHTRAYPLLNISREVQVNL